ncbi:MAG: hypothetical protein Q8942_18015 [Bacillota bacterium]|nr:hypothetical protein [Bacillota bacterium]
MHKLVKVTRVLGVLIGIGFAVLSFVAILAGIFDKSLFNMIDEPSFKEKSLPIIIRLFEYILLLPYGVILILPYSRIKKIHIFPRIAIFLYMIVNIVYWNVHAVGTIILKNNLYSSDDIFHFLISFIEDSILILNLCIFFNTALRNEIKPAKARKTILYISLVLTGVIIITCYSPKLSIRKHLFFTDPIQCWTCKIKKSDFIDKDYGQQYTIEGIYDELGIDVRFAYVKRNSLGWYYWTSGGSGP